MLKTYVILFFALVSLSAWEFDQKIIIEGVLRRAERTIIKDPNGKNEVKVEGKIVLVTDKPLILSRHITLGKEQMASTETSYSHIEVELPEEFIPLIGKRVQCHGNFKRSFNFIGDEIILYVDAALDTEQPIDQLKTVFYESDEVEVSGLLQEIIYPGPPAFMDIEKGDDFNDPEQGVRQIEVIFLESIPSAIHINGEIILKGTLFHAHTVHHHRRVLMMVKSWSVK